MKNLLAFDLGASNGRAILGRLENGKITMKELHRFENNYIEMNGVFYWDLPYLYNQLKLGLLAFKQENVGDLDCIGIDTWGVDYGLLDRLLRDRGKGVQRRGLHLGLGPLHRSRRKSDLCHPRRASPRRGKDW